MPTRFVALCLVLSLAPLISCAKEVGESTRVPEVDTNSTVIVPVDSKNRSRVFGNVSFTKHDNSITLKAAISGLPEGLHGIHIHETGDCSGLDASSAGGHWNPTGVQHGEWGKEPFHLGDIGNISSGPDGAGLLIVNTDLWTLGGGASNDILGKAIVIHSERDDFSSQPSGDSGDRLACGVIRLAR